MYIFARKCKHSDLNVIDAIWFINYVHMVEEGVAVKSSSKARVLVQILLLLATVC